MSKWWNRRFNRYSMTNGEELIWIWGSMLISVALGISIGMLLAASV